MVKQVAAGRTKMDHKNAISLLFPITIALKGGGLSKSEATEIFFAAFERAERALKGQRLEHVGDRIAYQNAIALWMRDKRFLDESGKPRALSMDGKNGFATLVRQLGFKVDPKAMLAVFLHYGTVRKIGKDKYLLAEAFFNSFSLKNFAFEPQVSFLQDASNTIGRMLVGRKKAMAPAPFWLRVENVDLSAAAAKKFSSFIKPRTLSFLEEVDEWLDAHSKKDIKSRRGKSGRRVGLGVFSIYSNAKS